jgi:hypothetical protein
MQLLSYQYDISESHKLLLILSYAIFSLDILVYDAIFLAFHVAFALMHGSMVGTRDAHVGVCVTFTSNFWERDGYAYREDFHVCGRCAGRGDAGRLLLGRQRRRRAE